MADEQHRERDDAKAGSPGKPEDLSMNVVPASVTAEPSEAGGRKAVLCFLVIGVLAVAGLGAWGIRAYSNLPPGEEAEQRLLTELRDLPGWQLGTVLRAGYVSGDTLRVDFAPSFLVTVPTEEGGRRQVTCNPGALGSERVCRERLRDAAREVMQVFVEHRPGRDLHIEGYQGAESVLRAEYRARSGLGGAAGEGTANIAVWVKGDPEEGLGQSALASGRVRTSQ